MLVLYIVDTAAAAAAIIAVAVVVVVVVVAVREGGRCCCVPAVYNKLGRCARDATAGSLEARRAPPATAAEAKWGVRR